MLTAIFSAVVFAAPVSAEPIELYRSFTVGEKFNYEVRSNLLVERRQIGMRSFIPSSVDINYDFNYEVTGVDAGGFADLVYRRPYMTIIDGETADRGQIVNREETNWNMDLGLSPINELVRVNEFDTSVPTILTSMPLSEQLIRSLRTAGQPDVIMGIIFNFAGELQRMSLFIGGLDSALDFSPKLPLEEVAVGETWRRTVSYQPQQMRDSDEFAVQRLDYVFTYEGIVESHGEQVHRIVGTLSLDTNAADYINQLARATPSQTGLQRADLKIEARIEFDLKLSDLSTIRANATSEGSFGLMIPELSDQYVFEERYRGRTSLRRTS